MDCIYCLSGTQVLNSRPKLRLNQVWRRRKCIKCANIFTTVEAADLRSSVMVASSKGDIRPFDRDRLFVSILKACGHRSSAIEDAGALSDTVITKLASAFQKAQVEASDITQVTHKVLANFDKSAAVQYAAYHKL